MPSITSWTRLEPRARTDEMQTSFQARIHDPLWLLARQWQFGEFAAEDAGSPVMARLRADCATLSRYRPGPLPANTRTIGQPYDSRRLPLETLVERESITADTARPTRRFAAQAGLQFLRLLVAEGVGKYRGDYIHKYAFVVADDRQQPALDSAGKHFLSVMAHRVADGLLLYDDLRDLPRRPDGRLDSLPPQPDVAAEDQSNVARAAGKWLAWFEALFSEPANDQPSWVSQRMEYAFAVAARGRDKEIVLEAPEYKEGHLDWYAFNMRHDASLGASEDNVEPEAIIRTVIPAPVTYRGMPASRWWEFEDAQVDFGDLDAAREDLTKLLFMEFALVYGNDWFVIPIDVPVGSLCEIRSLVVTDTFGERLLVRPYTEIDPPDSPWRLFRLQAGRRATARDADGGARNEPLFIPPVGAGSLQSSPLEEVLFLRDELANMAWAVERVVQSPTGQTINRFEALQEIRRREEADPQPAPAESAPLVYHLTTSVPDYWIPLVPVREQDLGTIRFTRGKLLQSGEEGLLLPQPRGRILEPDRELTLFEEEVSRTGARLTRSYQYTRWIDGATLVWIGRRKLAGRGEGWSGLRFDVVEFT